MTGKVKFCHVYSLSMRASKHTHSILAIALLFAVLSCIGWVSYTLFFRSPSATSDHVKILLPDQEKKQISPLPEQDVVLSSQHADADGYASPEARDGTQPAQESIPEEEDPVIIVETVQNGDTAGKILQPYLTAAQIQNMADACEKIFSLRRLRVGKPYEITLKKGELTRFVYEIDMDKKLIVTHADGVFAADLEDIVYDVAVRHVAGTITANLFQAVSDTGESAMLAIALADIFAWEINFIRDIHPGDTFTLLVEKRFREGEFKGYGRILAAEFINQGNRFEAYGFRDADGFPHYYNYAGESIKRAFLKAPLSFTRISSPFSPKRLHPILKVWRAHPGIDYAAPTGTPVKAVGNGVVTFKGWGKGAGNYIALRHNNNYETMYLHLSGFAKGLVKDKKVTQGEVIGFVGSTGDSTGPHLDFRMKKDGTYINPLSIASPRTEPISKKDMPEFKIIADGLRKKLHANLPVAESEKPVPQQAAGN